MTSFFLVFNVLVLYLNFKRDYCKPVLYAKFSLNGLCAFVLKHSLTSQVSVNTLVSSLRTKSAKTTYVYTGA